MALTQVSSEGIKDAQVKTADILDANITTAKVADANITTAKLADNAITGAKVADNLDIPDNNKIRFGTDNDLELYHTGSHGYILNKTGNLVIRAKDGETGIEVIPDGAVELRYNNSKKLETTSTGATVTGHLKINDASSSARIYLASGDSSDASLYFGSQNDTATGAIRYDHSDDSLRLYGYNNTERLRITSAGDINIPVDGDKLQFGAGQDLQIYHDGSNSYIDDAGTGHLLLKTNSTVGMKYGTDDIAKFIAAGAVELYYNNSKKFETLSTGVYAYGKFKVGDGDKLVAGDGDDLQIYHDGNNSFIKNSGTGSLNIYGDEVNILNAAASEYKAKFITDGAVELYYDNVKRFETFSTGAKWIGDLTTIDGGVLKFGTGNDLQIYHSDTGNASYITHSGAGKLHIASTGDDAYLKSSENVALMVNDTEIGVYVIKNGKVSLYHDNTEQCYTSANGLAFPSGKGIDFSADTGHSGTGGEVLTDFEYGTWTPTLYFLSNNGSITYHDQEGDYTKVGNRVFFSFNIRVNDLSSSAGNTLIFGLPYQVNQPTNGVGSPSGASLFPINGLNIGSKDMFCCQITAQPDIEFYAVTFGTGSNYSALQASQIDDGFHLKGQGHYCTNS